jgi:hypothetical protein
MGKVASPPPICTSGDTPHVVSCAHPLFESFRQSPKPGRRRLSLSFCALQKYAWGSSKASSRVGVARADNVRPRHRREIPRCPEGHNSKSPPLTLHYVSGQARRATTNPSRNFLRPALVKVGSWDVRLCARDDSGLEQSSGSGLVAPASCRWFLGVVALAVKSTGGTAGATKIGCCLGGEGGLLVRGFFRWHFFLGG